MKDDECEFTAGDDENTARIKIPVDAVTKGILKIGPAEKEKGISCIRSADEKYAVQDFTLEALDVYKRQQLQRKSLHIRQSQHMIKMEL